MQSQGDIKSRKRNAYEEEKEEIVRRDRKRMKDSGLDRALNDLRGTDAQSISAAASSSLKRVAPLPAPRAPRGSFGASRSQNKRARDESSDDVVDPSDVRNAGSRRSTRSRKAAWLTAEDEKASGAGHTNAEAAAGDRAAQHAERQAFLAKR